MALGQVNKKSQFEQIRIPKSPSIELSLAIKDESIKLASHIGQEKDGGIILAQAKIQNRAAAKSVARDF